MGYAAETKKLILVLKKELMTQCGGHTMVNTDVDTVISLKHKEINLHDLALVIKDFYDRPKTAPKAAKK